MKALKEFLGGSVGFGLEPRDDARPHRLERIGSRSPVALGLRSRSVRRPHLSVLPRGREAAQEAVEVGIAMWEDMQHLASRQPGEVLLDGANLVEEPQRVEGRKDGEQSLLHALVDARRSQQPCARRLGWVVALAHARPDAVFSASLNDGWKKFTNSRATVYSRASASTARSPSRRP